MFPSFVYSHVPSSSQSIAAPSVVRAVGAGFPRLLGTLARLGPLLPRLGGLLAGLGIGKVTVLPPSGLVGGRHGHDGGRWRRWHVDVDDDGGWCGG